VGGAGGALGGLGRMGWVVEVGAGWVWGVGVGGGGWVWMMLVLLKKQLEFDGHNWSSVTTAKKIIGDMKYAT